MTRRFLLGYPFFLLFLLFIDGQLTLLFRNLLSSPIVIAFHLTWFVILYFSSRLDLLYQVLVMSLLGFIYDLYYFSTLGLMVFVFPLAVIFLYQFQRFIRGHWVYRCLLFFVLLFFVESAAFLLGKGLGLTSDDLVYVMTYSLAPSLVVNTLLLLVSYLGLEKYLSW